MAIRDVHPEAEQEGDVLREKRWIYVNKTHKKPQISIGFRHEYVKVSPIRIDSVRTRGDFNGFFMWDPLGWTWKVKQKRCRDFLKVRISDYFIFYTHRINGPIKPTAHKGCCFSEENMK